MKDSPEEKLAREQAEVAGYEKSADETEAADMAYNLEHKEELKDSDLETWREHGMWYVDAPPTKIRKGLVLVHNLDYAGQKRTSLLGFRAWLTTGDPERQVPCDCGWTTLPHFKSRQGSTG